MSTAVGAFLAGAGLGGLGITMFLRHQYNNAIEDERQRSFKNEKRREELRILERNNDQQGQHALRLKYQQVMSLESGSKDSKGAEGDAKDSKGAEGDAKGQDGAEGPKDAESSVFDLNSLYGLILSGKEFNALISAKNLKFVKLLTQSEKQFKMQYKSGLNTDIEPFNAVYNCFGGLYQTEIRHWREHGSSQNGPYTHYRPVISYPDDTIVKIENCKVKSHAVILGEPASLDDLDK